MGEVSLLQYNDGFLDMPVKEMNPHRHPRRHLSPKTFDGEVPCSSGGWESYILGARISDRSRGSPMPSPAH